MTPVKQQTENDLGRANNAAAHPALLRELAEAKKEAKRLQEEGEKDKMEFKLI